MGAFEWLLDKLHKADFDKSRCHSPLHTVQQCHHIMIRFTRAQLAHRDAQLERVRSERGTHFAQKEKLLDVYSAAKRKTLRLEIQW